MFCLTSQEFIQAIPVILSLIFIEGLLSVDNALAIASMASHLPEKQRSRALTLGMLGAYLFRCVALVIAAWLSDNEWVKLFGAAYLVWLMCDHFTTVDDEEHGVHHAAKGFVATVVAIQFLDLSLSVDNVVAAVAMAPKHPPDFKPEMWVVYCGVLIGILTLRFLAQACIRLLQRFPVLEHTAYLLIGYVGFILIYEVYGQRLFGLEEHPHVEPYQKFIGVALILWLSLLYGQSPAWQRTLRPAFHAVRWPMRMVALAAEWLVWPVRCLIRLIRKKPSGRETTA